MPPPTSSTTMLVPIIVPTTITSVDVTTLYSLLTSTITIPPIPTSYSTTYALATPNGTTTEVATTSVLWITTLPAATLASVYSIPYSTISRISTVTNFITLTPTAPSETVDSTSSGLTPIDTLHATPTSLQVIPNGGLSKLEIGLISAFVPIAGIMIIAAFFCIRKSNCRHSGPPTPSESPHSIDLRHIVRLDDTARDQDLPFPPSPFPPPTRPPPPPPISRSAELRNNPFLLAPPIRAPPPPPTSRLVRLGNGSFRMTSPQRPERPLSITESVLNVMSTGSGPGSDAAVAPVEDRTSRQDDETDDFIPDTDASHIYDGTRKKYLRTAIEHDMPLTQLTRLPLGAPHPSGHKVDKRRSFAPERIRVHKRSTTDPDHNSRGYGREVTKPEPSEQMFKSNLMQTFSSTPPPSKKNINNNTDLMADASSEEGSHVGHDEKLRKREATLAALEGRAPAPGSERVTGPLSDIEKLMKLSEEDDETAKQWF